MVDLFTRGGAHQQEQQPAEEGEWAGAFCEKRSKWSEQRAIIVKKPTEPVLVKIGEVVFVPIEVLNSTKWPWKQGCILTTSPKQSAALQGIVFDNIAIDCDVKGM